MNMDNNLTSPNMETTSQSSKQPQIDPYYQGYHNIFKLGAMVMGTLCQKYDVKLDPIVVNMLAQGALVIGISKDPYLVTETDPNKQIQEATKLIASNKDNADKAFEEQFKRGFK
jgi:hypothetical protein